MTPSTRDMRSVSAWTSLRRAARSARTSSRKFCMSARNSSADSGYWHGSRPAGRGLQRVAQPSPGRYERERRARWPPSGLRKGTPTARMAMSSGVTVGSWALVCVVAARVAYAVGTGRETMTTACMPASCRWIQTGSRTWWLVGQAASLRRSRPAKRPSMTPSTRTCVRSAPERPCAGSPGQRGFPRGSSACQRGILPGSSASQRGLPSRKLSRVSADFLPEALPVGLDFLSQRLPVGATFLSQRLPVGPNSSRSACVSARASRQSANINPISVAPMPIKVAPTARMPMSSGVTGQLRGVGLQRHGPPRFKC